MKVGIMLRHLHPHRSDLRRDTHHLLRHLLNINCPHHFTLLYQSPKPFNSFANEHNHHRLREVTLSSPSALAWEQFAVRRAAKRYRLDVVFNPDAAIPLACPCPAVFVCRSLRDVVISSHTRLSDRLRRHVLLPRYATRASAVITASESTRLHLHHFLHTPLCDIHTIYPGIHDAFGHPISDALKQAVRRRYALPARFFLHVGHSDPSDNLDRLLRAYATLGPARGIHLILLRQNPPLRRHESKRIDQLKLNPWVRHLGPIDHDILPALYALAQALVMPSLYEAFPRPLLHALAVGCPVLTSDRFGCLELGQDLATLVDPENTDDIAAGLTQILDAPDHQRPRIAKARHRAMHFTWHRCAAQIVQLLETVAHQQSGTTSTERPSEKDHAALAQKLA